MSKDDTARKGPAPLPKLDKQKQEAQQNDENVSADTPNRAPKSSQLRDRRIASDAPIDVGD